MNSSEILDRVKTFLNAKSDNELSIKLGKYPSYISQIRKRNTVDFELILSFCYDADFNWLITGEPSKNRLIATIDLEYGRKTIDLNEKIEKMKKELEDLRERVVLQRKLLESYENKTK